MKKTVSLLFLLLLAPAVLSASQTSQVAGSFYPAHAKELEMQVNHLLQDPQPSTEIPRILMVPHAGYDYSGAVAGLGFRKLQGSGIQTVIVLGAAHQYPQRIDGALIDSQGTFETPLGKIEIDEETSNRLLSLSKKIKNGPEAFAGEHSVEVELPFLQQITPGFKLVPLVMNAPDLENARDIGEVLAQVMRENENAGKKTLLVVSSDLAHYPSQKDAEFSDLQMLKSIEAVDPEGLFKNSQAMMQRNLPNLVTTMCGEAGILTGLYAAKMLGILEGETVRHATSADAPEGDPERTVGYASVVFYNAPGSEEKALADNAPKMHLTQEEKKELLQHARDSVRLYLESKTVLKNPKDMAPAFELPRAVFVTIRKNGELRGCIGGTEPVWPLGEAVAYYARAAAFEDPRFVPVTKNELDALSFEISLLSPRQKIRNAEAVRSGIDGVLLVQGEHSGLFLPQVWKETGWNKETFLSELAGQKAGLPRDAWKDPRTELFTFTVDTFEEK